MADNTSFLSRWSQRKVAQQNLDNSEQLPEQPPQALQAEDETQPLVSEADEVVLTDADMPDVASLNETSDFSQFFSSGVSEELRDLALQKLFRLPEFNLRDGLNDYDEDFSKLPALTEAVAAQLRNWIEEKTEETQENLKQQLTEEKPEEEPVDANTEANQTETTEQSASYSAFSAQDELDEDDLGDADLDG